MRPEKGPENAAFFSYLKGCALYSTASGEPLKSYKQENELIRFVFLENWLWFVRINPNVHRSTVYNSQDMEVT